MKRKKIALMLAVILAATTIGTEPAVTYAQETGEDNVQSTEEQENTEADFEEAENTDDSEIDLTEEADTAEETVQEEADDGEISQKAINELEMTDPEEAEVTGNDELNLETGTGNDDFSDGSDNALAAEKGEFVLNKEITLHWENEEDWTYVYFTPEKKQSYVITVSENGTDGHAYDLYTEDGAGLTIQNTFSNINGKTYLKTPVLKAGQTYKLYFEAVAGETEVQLGIYDDLNKLWESATTLGSRISDSIARGKKALSWGTSLRQPSTRIYKITVSNTGDYTYQVNGLKQTIVNNDYTWDVVPDLYNADGTVLSRGNSNSDNSDTAVVSGKLEEGKTYYLLVCNYSTYNSYTYNILRAADVLTQEALVNGTKGTLNADASHMYKVNIDKDGVYQFADPTVSTAVEKLFYMYDSEMEDITDEGENHGIVSTEGKKSLTYTIYLKKGTYYLKLKNNASKTTSYEITKKTITLKDVKNISLSATNMKMEIGQKKVLTASISPSDSTFKSLNWNISNVDVADRVYNEKKNTYEIVAKAAGTCDITVTAKNGKSVVCHVTVVNGHDYKTVTTPATLTQDGTIATKCSLCGKVKESKTIVRPTKFQLSATKYTYDGKVKTPSVTVTDSKGKKLTTADYSVSYTAGRKDAGNYSAKITFKGKYKGTKTLSFTIAKATPKLSVKASAQTINAKAKAKLTVSGSKGTLGYATSDKKIATVSKGTVTGIKTGTVTITVTSAATKNYNKATAKVTMKIRPTAVSVLKAVSAKSGQITVTWKKNTTTDRYQIQYSTNSKFQKASTVTVTSNTKTSQTITRLAGKKKYYVRIRAVDKTGKLYSGWSKVLTATTKK